VTEQVMVAFEAASVKHDPGMVHVTFLTKGLEFCVHAFEVGGWRGGGATGKYGSKGTTGVCPNSSGKTGFH